MADGVFTPAVSVTSAVAGIGVVKASVTAHITPISIVSTHFVKLVPRLKNLQAFLLALFLVQRFGTGRISFTFAPSRQVLKSNFSSMFTIFFC